VTASWSTSELPASHSTAGPGVAEGVPRGQRVRVLLLQLGFEPAEGALALDSPRQSPPGSLVADLIGEVGHVLVADVGRHRIDADQIQLVKVNGGLAIDSGVGCPEHHFPGLWVDQPPVLVVGCSDQAHGHHNPVRGHGLRHYVGDLRSPSPFGPHNA